MAAQTWVVEAETASMVHVPTGMRVHFVQDREDENAWEGLPGFCPPALLSRADDDGGKEFARLMRQACGASDDWLRKRRQ